MSRILNPLLFLPPSLLSSKSPLPNCSITLLFYSLAVRSKLKKEQGCLLFHVFLSRSLQNNSMTKWVSLQLLSQSLRFVVLFLSISASLLSNLSLVSPTNTYNFPFLYRLHLAHFPSILSPSTSPLYFSPILLDLLLE